MWISWVLYLITQKGKRKQFEKKIHFTCKDKHRLNIKGWKMIVYPKEIQKPVGVAILITDKADFESKLEETKKVTVYL